MLICYADLDIRADHRVDLPLVVSGDMGGTTYDASDEREVDRHCRRTRLRLLNCALTDCPRLPARLF